MNRAELAASIDHTVLGAETTPADVERVVDEAVEYGMNVCIPPCYVTEARDYGTDDLTVATVVGFPHGQHATTAKVAEAEIAHEDGADELDLVANVGRVKAGQLDEVEADIAAVVDATPLPVKVIIETIRLDDGEKHGVCQAAEDAGADVVKTATGFSGGGATVEDVELMSEYLPVKASGGVGNWAQAKAMFDAGAVRIGASSGVEIVESFEE